MSYNITRWETKTIDNLTVSPMDARKMLGENPESDITSDEHRLTFYGSISEGFELSGVLENGLIHIDKISHWGIGSGSQFNFLEDLLICTSGKLEAVLIWEGGDLIERLTVENGEIDQTRIDL